MGGVRQTRRTIRRESCGFTLIELLMVLMIMGLTVGLVTALARPDDRGLLQIEAERLAQLLTLAATESRLTGKSIGWTADGPGYRFWRLRADTGWTEIRDSELLRARTLPAGMMISGLRVENMRAHGPMRLQFSGYSPMLSFLVDLSLGAEHVAVAASPLGEVRVVSGLGSTNGRMAPR